MIAMTGRRSILILLGTTVVASVSLGGWKMWMDTEPVATPLERTTQTVPVAQTVSVQAVPMDVVAKATEVKAAPKLDRVPTTLPTSAKVDEVRTKEMPKGKKHAKQEELLAAMAQRFHTEAYTRFINQPGMGQWRMDPFISVMPREWKIPEWTSEEITKEQPPVKGLKDLSLIHRLSMNQFAASNREGSKGTAEQLAGANEKKEMLWEIKSLNLVGLVMHETAKVYVSEKLPQMKDLAKTPIRDLDVFESEGLEELMNGKDLYVRSKEGTIRVLGPIRASKACLKCHGDTKDGEMLGAFSYTLRPGEYRRGGFQDQFPGGGVQPQVNPRFQN